MAAAAELTSLKLAPSHNNYCSYSQNCSFFLPTSTICNPHSPCSH